MSKGKKRKGAARAPEAVSSSGAADRDSTPAVRDSPQKSFTPHPPRRNVPLLATSVVLLVVWIGVLTWLALTA